MAELVDIPEYEKHYAITCSGKIWSYKSKKWLKQRLNDWGYLKVNLSKNGSYKEVM